MAISPQGAERLVKLLVYLGGVASTAAGALFASRVRVYEDSRRAHLEELKQKVLIPLRNGLEQHFRPLVFNSEPLIFVKAAALTGFRENAKSTESQVEQGDVLQEAFPSALVFGPLDSALLADARKKHFFRLMTQVDEFEKKWSAYGPSCYSWVLQMATRIRAATDLPPFPNRLRSARGPSPYVMHYRLAVFIYKRLFRLSAPALESFNMNDGTNWTLNSEEATVACGAEEQITRLLGHLDKLLESEKATADTLSAKTRGLQESFRKLISDLDYAIVSRRLRKRCDLVPFF